jgi:hypothetical protein
VADYASNTDVQARVAGRTIGASSKPTATQVDQWCTEAEHMLEGALQACGISLPGTSDDGADIIKSWICDYAEGHTRMAWEDSEIAGQGLVDRFMERLRDIIPAKKSFYDGMLNGGDPSDTARRCRGYVLDNEDDLTIADDDFDPEFPGDEEWW